MPILYEPPFPICSAYRPIVWDVFFTAVSPNEIALCEFTIEIDGVLQNMSGKKAYYQVSPGALPTVFEYHFQIDIQQHLQRYLAPNRSRSSMFGTLNGDTRVDNTDAFVEVRVFFQYYNKDGTTGKISAVGSPEVSSVRYVDITTLQNGMSMNQSDLFYGVPFATGSKRFLTNAPNTQPTCATQNHFLSFISVWNFARVRTYNSGGTLIDTFYFKTNGTTAQQTTIGVGMPQLDAMPISAWLGGFAPVWTGVSYYIIDCGLGMVTSPTTIIYLSNSETRTFTIEDCCDRKIQLFWLNSLGGVDTRKFSFKELQLSVNSDIFEKALGWNNTTSPYHSQDDFGKSRVNIKADRLYRCTGLFTNSELEWIKELFYSAEVYIQNPDGSAQYWRVYPESKSYTEKRYPGLTEIEFNLNISQDVITHRI